MRRVPTVFTHDCTPRVFDEVVAGYGRRPPGRIVGWCKHLWYRLAFHRAHTLVAWNRWTADSFVRDYGVPPAKVQVLHPGIDLRLWTYTRRDLKSGAPLRLLFVGGDFARKGGLLLLEAMRDLAGRGIELDIVSGDPQAVAGPGVRVHRGLKSNDERLRALYAEADVFVLPTSGECAPWVILEAMASGLPVISTRIAAIPEALLDGETGLLMPPGDGAALVKAITTLQGDAALRLRLGKAGRERIERHFNADTNMRLLIDILKKASVTPQ